MAAFLRSAGGITCGDRAGGVTSVGRTGDNTQQRQTINITYSRDRNFEFPVRVGSRQNASQLDFRSTLFCFGTRMVPWVEWPFMKGRHIGGRPFLL